MRAFVVFFALFTISITGSFAQDGSYDKKIIFSQEAPKPIGSYSQAVLAGNTLYLSGQIAIDTSGKLIECDIRKETEIVMTNIKNVLYAAGCDMSNIVKTTIYLTDMNNFSQVNEVYSSFFSGDYPARETVQVAKLPKNANVEISVIAVLAR